MKSFILIAVLFLVGCSKSSDPAKDYSDVKAVPNHGKEFGTQGYEYRFFTFEIEKMNFIAGKSQQTRIFVKPTDPSITKYHAIPEGNDGLPPGATLKAVEQGVYLLEWNPDIRLLEKEDRNFRITLRGFVDASTKPIVTKQTVSPPSFQVILLKSTSQPKISVRGLEPKTENIPQIEVDTKKEVILTVDDPSSTNRNPPLPIYPHCEGNPETPQVDAGEYMKTAKIETGANGRFVYHLLLDLTKPLANPKNSKLVEMCLQVAVTNETGATSGIVLRTFQVVFKPRTPVFSMFDNQAVTAMRGGSFSSSFHLDGRDYGDLIVTSNAENLPASENNSPTLECKPVNTKKNQQKCHFSWRIPNDTPIQNYTVAVVAKQQVEVENSEPARINLVIRVIDAEANTRKPPTPRPVTTRPTTPKAKPTATPPKPSNSGVQP